MHFSFIHAADLHLGSPFRTAAAKDPNLAELLKEAMFRAFSNLIVEARRRKVDMLLLSGDTFDLSDIPPVVWLRFLRGIRELEEAGIHVYMVCGNHDPYPSLPISGEGRGHVPGNLTIFPKGRWQSLVHKRPGPEGTEDTGEPVAIISGISFARPAETRNLASALESRKHGEGLFHLALLHTNVGARAGHEPYAPCSVDDLLRHRVDYWALGHIHERLVLHEFPHVVYPGVIQGRGFREVGQKGAFYCKVADGQVVEHSFLPLSGLIFQEKALDISGASSLSQVEEAILEVAREDGRKKEGPKGLSKVMRFVIKGQCPLSGELSDPQVQEALLESVNCALEAESEGDASSFRTVVEIRNRTMAELDLDQRAEAEDMAGLVLAERRRILDLGREGAEELRQVLRELFENPALSRDLEPLTDQELLDLVDEAARVALWKLEPSGSEPDRSGR